MQFKSYQEQRDAEKAAKQTKNKRQFKIHLTLLALCFLPLLGLSISRILTDYNYSFTYTSQWNLADKSSSIEAKEKYINSMLQRFNLNQQQFASHNALFLKTEDNEFNANLTALSTLATRLNDIKSMDPKSFEYNTAIQQITAQEQGEAHAMLATLHGCYLKGISVFLWDWVFASLIFILILSSAYNTFACLYNKFPAFQDFVDTFK